MEIPKIFWKLRRLEAGLSGFKLKEYTMASLGCKLSITHPINTKPNTPSHTLTRAPPSPQSFFFFFVPLLFGPATAAAKGDGGDRRPSSLLPSASPKTCFPFSPLRPPSSPAQLLASSNHYQRRWSHFRRWRARIWRETPDTSSGESLLFVLTSFSFTLWYILWEAEFGLRIWDQQST